MLEKIRYRLVYNRQKKLNKQGTALVQVEAYLNQRKAYFKTNVYLKPEHWSKQGAQVVNHPQSNELNAMLYGYILDLQAIELNCWKNGIDATLSKLKEFVKKDISPSISFLKFAQHTIENSDRKARTKDNMLVTVATLKEFRGIIDFKDLNYTFLKDFDVFLRNKGLQVNTIGKHMRVLRTLINEAINQGYIPQDAYPFRKFKIKKEQTEHRFLLPNELEKMESLKLPEKKNNSQHVLDAFLFCCYTGLRYSDFCQLTPENFIRINGKRWLYFKSVKTGVEIRLPLHLLFESRALGILDRYPDIGSFAALPCNSEVNKQLRKLAGLCGIKKRITYHVSRHTCATLLVHQGVAITTVQKLLGHTSVKTTQIYSEVLSSTIVRDLKNVQRKRKKVKMFPDKGLRTSDFIDNR